MDDFLGAIIFTTAVLSAEIDVILVIFLLVQVLLLGVV